MVQSVNVGEDASFTIAASNHYRIAEIRTNDVTIGTLPGDLVTTNFVWRNVRTNGTISAVFAPLVRQAVITAFSVAGATVTMGIENLTAESSNAVERALDLSSNQWDWIGGFITPSSCATNWTGTDTADTTPRFYRVRTRIP